MKRFVPHVTEMELGEDAARADEAALSCESSSLMVEMVGDWRINSDRDWIAAIGRAKLCVLPVLCEQGTGSREEGDLRCRTRGETSSERRRRTLSRWEWPGRLR